MKTCDTLSGAIYDQDFNLADDHLHCPGLELKLHPADESILYAIELDEGVRGLLVSAYGAYSTPTNDALMQKLTMPIA